MSAALANVPQSTNYLLKVLDGPEKGAKFKLVAPQIRIGRGSDNDISFPEDPRCSRLHAVLIFSNEGYVIESASSTNPVLVNKKPVTRHVLQSRDIVQIGDSRVQFVKKTEGKELSNKTSAPLHLAQKRSSGSGVKNLGKKQKFYLMIIGVFSILGWLLFSGNKSKVEEAPLRSSEMLQSDIESTVEKAQKVLKQKSNQDSLPFREAQSAYVQGFRDYKKGLYSRAMESFQACLSLYPKHQLCQRYLKQSQKRFNELAQYQIIQGRRRMEKNQFDGCKAAFRNVMIMVKDQNSKIYKEAKANYEACDAFLKGRY